jgi:hypothetical protein
MPTGITYHRGMYAWLLPKSPLGSPEASHGEKSTVQMALKWRRHRLTRYQMISDNVDRGTSPRQTLFFAW